jgi:syntaxin 7
VNNAKLAKDFQAVLVEFQNAQKIAQDREKFYIPFVAQAFLPTRYNTNSGCGVQFC